MASNLHGIKKYCGLIIKSKDEKGGIYPTPMLSELTERLLVFIVVIACLLLLFLSLLYDAFLFTK